ncbi:MAG: hypothetical protein AVDCRST_MAG37-952 [uncultured Rubrobacteraceae bacterium]|uniref:DUF2029 domain-containing protein n=1 Tax=uncultured Rubrobacteraceae bacterium TaxID=349277 RepID=A0A6J4Q6G1_9ACTN|nr:MAG: hypothetical protein AVDCRST_MAG37-952 [uncultured Rubrobacteraceae bacterium]
MRLRPAVVLLLLPLLLAVFGFAPGPDMNSEEAQRAASSVPEISELLSHPSVESNAEYQPSDDAWRVLVRESVEGMIIAELTVADDTKEVEQVEVYPSADTVDYPNLSEEDAIKLALANPEVRSELSDHAPYTSEAEYEDGRWTVHLKVKESGLVGGMPAEDGTKEIVRVEVDDDTWQLNYVWTGDQVGWHMARGDYGAYGKQANYWYVWGSLAFLFAVAFWRPDKLLSLRNFDVIALLGFLVSHSFFRAGDSYWAVLLWYPPLLYLLGRALMMGFGYGERVDRTSNLPTPVLFVLGLLGSGLVLGLNLDSRVIDVGYAGVVGGDRILDGTLPYGNMPSNVGTGDTYGPLNYLLYTPFRWFFGWSGEWDFLPAAHGLTALAFVVGAIALFITGYRYAGARGGSTLLFAWSVFPYTLYSTNNNTNDVVIAAVAAVGLATAANPLARGASVAAGFAIKLFPIILGPLWLLHDGVRRRVSILDFILGGMAVILLSFWVLALDGDLIGGVQLFYERTIAFQGTRETPWTIFSQVPELKVLQQPLTALVILLAFVVAIFPRKRTIRRLAAFSAALIIAFELTVNYWFYPYVTWFEPFVFLALLLETNEKTALDSKRQSAVSDQGKAETSDQR